MLVIGAARKESDCPYVSKLPSWRSRGLLINWLICCNTEVMLKSVGCFPTYQKLRTFLVTWLWKSWPAACSFRIWGLRLMTSKSLVVVGWESTKLIHGFPPTGKNKFPRWLNSRKNIWRGTKSKFQCFNVCSVGWIPPCLKSWRKKFQSCLRDIA